LSRNAEVSLSNLLLTLQFVRLKSNSVILAHSVGLTRLFTRQGAIYRLFGVTYVNAHTSDCPSPAGVLMLGSSS